MKSEEAASAITDYVSHVSDDRSRYLVALTLSLQGVGELFDKNVIMCNKVSN